MSQKKHIISNLFYNKFMPYSKSYTFVNGKCIGKHRWGQPDAYLLSTVTLHMQESGGGMCLVTVKYKSVVYSTKHAPHELRGLIIPASAFCTAMYGDLKDRGPLIIGNSNERPHIHLLYQFINIKHTGMLHSKHRQTLLTKYKRIISFFSRSRRNVTHHLAQYCVARGEGPAQQMDRCNFSSIKLWFIVQHSNPRLHTTLCTDSYETLYFHCHSPGPR